MRRRAIVALAAGVIAVGVTAAAFLVDDSGRARPSRAEFGERFEQTGIQVGQTWPDVELHALDGSGATLETAWRDRPALLVTASLTCPVARNHHAQVAELAQRFAGRIHVGYLYTIEAHPLTDPSPYSVDGEEWVGGPNQKLAILHRQPASLAARLELARRYQQRLQVRVPMYVDNMADEAWSAAGGGPNIGLLFRPGGVLAVKHGWFDGPTMAGSVQHLLDSLPAAAATGL